VAAELAYHASMGDAAIACTAAALRNSGTQPESAGAVTARRFCDEALVQVEPPPPSCFTHLFSLTHVYIHLVLTALLLRS
jgi:hypothetical protein